MKTSKKQGNLTEKVINFIKYHNGFVIGLMLVFVFSGAIFASEDLRNTIVGQKIVTQNGVDNIILLASDLENFDLAMTINGIFEDENNYYVDYSFKTIGVIDDIWQEMTRDSRMTIAKAAVGDRDLGLYIAEELAEITDYELAYLKQVQTSEKKKGQTQIVQTTEYTGLVGLVLDIKNKVLPGYEPVEQLAQVEEQMFGEFTPKEPEPSEQIPWFEPENEQQSQEQLQEQEQEPVDVPEIPGIDTTTQSSDGIDIPDIPGIDATTSPNDGI